MTNVSEIKMVVTDLDGTLLRDDKSVSAYTQDVIRKLRNRGVLFVIATARPIRAVKKFLPWVSYDAAVFHNGAVVEDGGRRLGKTGIQNPLEIVTAILRDRPKTKIAVESNDEMYSNFDAGEFWKGIEYTATADFHETEGLVADKIILEARSGAEMEVFRPYLRDGLYIQLSENRLATIHDLQSTKRNGIELIAREHGMSLAQVAAFGDDYNDREMLMVCGIGVAVANALEEVKAAAAYVCGSNEQDGVARWLEENLAVGKGSCYCLALDGEH